MRECDKQEKRVCKQLGGRVQIASGSTPFYKGDGVLEDLLIECKTKDKPSKSIAVQKAWFEKLRHESFQMGKDGGILVFGFGDGKDYVAERLEDFEEHYKAYRRELAIRDIINQDGKEISSEELILKIKGILEG
jgi:hypothetical protein